ncbi:putative efflux pump kojT [Fulvia fulva]|uniref:Efflux pump kojT n=1 Tax=Passalora fulva TaxID=5499 RepID=A0A9Q8PIA8_PASFU|nr:putative efflux pump kojT [Fulvia fulva]KAK4626678.1 putative efflux pump kojT [Fulvia fulva]KAK4627475.1 putative efflux pump kojT [Fulvia fulva]UJO22942.1 putative efflux pump kojT [Fulvia fulva]WPV14089.1 putative efflux pump kojT [Fulvia fulva]WPV29130.1 putative efflux pump kojT [Fulvia fulva]
MATGLFLVGFGLGALFAGPISETVGRNPVYITTLVLYMIFIMASALAPIIGAQLAFRFLAGLFGSTPLTCAGGSISDLWNPLERVFAFPVFANAASTGPLLGPIIGGYIAQSSLLSWRWTEWITLIISGLVLFAVVLFQPETYPQTLLKWKAQHLRSITGDDRYRAAIEIRQETLFVRLRRALYRPIFLTVREPIIILLALYLTVIYIVLFTFLDGYTYIFQETYGISQGLTGICFLNIVVGLFGASALYIIDSYESFAASALASITLIRYVAAGGMTVVGVPFYENLGVHYTMTILACISVPLVPVPYVFYRYGPWIRERSRYAIQTTTEVKTGKRQKV